MLQSRALRAAVGGVSLCLGLIALVAASRSPLLAWRDPVYIIAGFAGVVAMVLLVFQPLLIKGLVPGPPGRKLHRVFGGLVLLSVVGHVVGLWITSPPDVIDVLLLRSPTPFALWGLIAMWAVLATALLAVTRRRWRLAIWRRCHVILALLIAGGTVLHAVQIDGTMEALSKYALSALLIAVNGWVIWGVMRPRARAKERAG